MSYLTRALRSSDPRYLHILTRLGYGVVAPSPPFDPAPLPDEDDDEGGGQGGGQADNPAALKAAREQYERVTGKRPYYGWDIAELARRIADFHRGNES